MAKTPKTKKMTFTAWCKLDKETRKRALSYICGENFLDYLSEESTKKGFVYWPLIAKNVRILVDSDYKVLVFGQIFI